MRRHSLLELHRPARTGYRAQTAAHARPAPPRHRGSTAAADNNADSVHRPTRHEPRVKPLERPAARHAPHVRDGRQREHRVLRRRVLGSRRAGPSAAPFTSGLAPNPSGVPDTKHDVSQSNCPYGNKINSPSLGPRPLRLVHGVDGIPERHLVRIHELFIDDRVHRGAPGAHEGIVRGPVETGLVLGPLRSRRRRSVRVAK